jgi:hypothetical protein
MHIMHPFFIMKTLGKGCFGSFGTHYRYFDYFLWEKQSWLTTNLSYDQPSGTNWVRKSRVHCTIKSTDSVAIAQRRISQTQPLYYIKMCVRVGDMFRPFEKPSSGHPLENNSIKPKTYEMLAHCGIPCGLTKLVMDKNRQNQFWGVKY